MTLDRSQAFELDLPRAKNARGIGGHVDSCSNLIEESGLLDNLEFHMSSRSESKLRVQDRLEHRAQIGSEQWQPPGLPVQHPPQ